MPRSIDGEDTEIVTITVNGANDSPFIVGSSDLSGSVTEDDAAMPPLTGMKIPSRSCWRATVLTVRWLS